MYCTCCLVGSYAELAHAFEVQLVVRVRVETCMMLLLLGSVIKAWDIGVASMKRGELAVLLCKPEYAYGKTGSGSKIPPDSTLVFEVELFDWKGEDITYNAKTLFVGIFAMIMWYW